MRDIWERGGADPPPNGEVKYMTWNVRRRSYAPHERSRPRAHDLPEEPMTTTISSTGPILAHLPPPPDVRTRLALTERLQGHTTSESWLPAGIWRELDALRDEQLRHRRQVVEVLEALNALDARFKQEDAEHTQALRQARP